MEISILNSKFKDFLISEKDYPVDSFLWESSIRGTTRVFRPDLLLIDPNNKDYLAIVEFKTENAPSSVYSGFTQLNEYARAISFNNKTLPVYVVVPFVDDFLIYTYKGKDIKIGKINASEYKLLSKDDFPSFKSLSAKIQIDEKILEQEISYLSAIESQRSKGIARSAIFGVIAGAITLLSLYFYYFISNRIASKRNIETVDFYEIKDKAEKLNQRLIVIEKEFNKKSQYTSIDSVDKFRLNDRVKQLESMLSKEPEKTLSILEIKSEVKEIKNLLDGNKTLYEEKITGLKDKVDSLNTITISLLVTIVGTFLAGAFQFISNNKKP